MARLIPGVKRPDREADHSPTSSAEVKNLQGCASTLPILLHGVMLITPQENTGLVFKESLLSLPFAYFPIYHSQ